MALIPLKDDNPLARIHFQYVTVALIAIWVAVFFWQASLRTVNSARVVYGLGSPPVVLLGDKKLPPEFAMAPAEMTLLTSMFLHGRWMHLICNMLYFWVFGDNVEDPMGHGRFLAFYLLCGLMASSAHVATNLSSEVTTIGAFGIIFSILGANLVLHPRAQVLTLVVRFPMRYRPSSSWACGLGCSSPTPR